MDKQPVPTVYALSLVTTCLAAACSGEPLDVDLDAGSIEPSDNAGHDVVALDEPPEVGPPEDSVVAENDMPEWARWELELEPVEKAIVGKVDSRVRIRNSQIAPYKAVVQVLTQWLKGEAAIPCTGTMVAADAVLTA